MSYNLVNPTTGALTRVAGGTLYADLPIGSWVKNDMDAIPSGFLKEGDTISQTLYPELYAKYGSTVPYKADTSELSNYNTSITFEQITAGYTMPYDGVLNIGANSTAGSVIAYVTINGERIVNIGTSSYTGSFVKFNKGDVVKAYNITTSNYMLKVAYYTKSLIVKAKHTPVPADFMDAVDDAMNSIDFATIVSGTANVSVGDYICSKNIKNVCAMIKCHTSGIVPPSTKICSGFFTPLTPSTYPYLDIPFAIRNRTTNVTEMRMGYLDTNGDFYTSMYTENIESDWDIQLFFSYITD